MGRYFVGAIARNTFGPLVRFACGAEFAAPLEAKALSRAQKERPPHVPASTIDRAPQQADAKPVETIKAA